MMRIVARTRPITASRNIRPLYLRPTFTTAESSLSSRRQASTGLHDNLTRNQKFSHTQEDERRRVVELRLVDGDFKYMKNVQLSEVATTEFLRTALKLPVPAQWLWVDSDLNSGKMGIAAFRAEGTQASTKAIPEVDLATKVRLVCSFHQIMNKVSSIAFDRYGSLYRPSGEFPYEIPGSHRAKFVEGASSEQKQLIESQFYIGPSCEPRVFQGDGRHLMEEYHGPWTSAIDYVESLLRCEIDILSKKIDQKDSVDGRIDQTGTPYQIHVELLQKALSIVPHIMPKDSKATAPRLHHPALILENLFVDQENRPMAIVGWSGAWVGPSFANLAWALEFGEDCWEIQPEQLSEELKQQVTEGEYEELYQSLLERSAMLKAARKNPILPLIHIAMKTRRYGVMPLQIFLMHIHSHWIEFDAAQPCPFQIPLEAKMEANRYMDKLAEGDNVELSRAIFQIGMWALR